MNWTSKFYLFIGIFSFCIFAYLILPYFTPFQSLANGLDIFDADVENFIFFMSLAAIAAFTFAGLFCFAYQKIRRKTRYRSKFGEILISLELITREDLEKALKQQQLRIGEILVQSGHITAEQRDYALMIQKKDYHRLGKILRGLDFTTEEDIRWALKIKDKRLGGILKEMNLITDYDIESALDIKNTFRIDKSGMIVLDE